MHAGGICHNILHVDFLRVREINNMSILVWRCARWGSSTRQSTSHVGRDASVMSCLVLSQVDKRTSPVLEGS